MAKTFDLKKFTNGLSSDLLQEYCAERKLNFTHDDKEKTSDEAFEQFFSDLEREKQKSVELDFTEVNNLITGQATFLLIEYANKNNISRPVDFDVYSQNDKAMWFYLNAKDIFNRVYQEHEFQDIIGWKNITSVKKQIDDPEDKAVKLSSALSVHLYSQQWRGRNCYVRTYPYEKCVYFIAYPEDYAVAEMQYDEKSKLVPLHTKPVDRIFFMYEPETGRIGVKAKGGKAKIQEYQVIFNNIVLEDLNTLSNDRIFDLNNLKNPSFSFNTPSDYRVQYVKIKSVVIKTLDDMMKLVIDVYDKEKTGISEIQEAFNRLNLHRDTFVIYQAVIQVKFEKTGIYRSKDSVTVRLTWPNSHDLANNPLDNKVKELLKIWELDTQK